MHQFKKSPHTPVLLDEVVELLTPQKGESYLDLTAGYGGHASKILEMTNAADKAVLVDRDEQAIAYLSARFKDASPRIIHSDFLKAAQELETEGKRFDLILADLGVSSAHLDNASRGFSMTMEGPLDMRMDRQQILTAEEIINNFSEDELAEILSQYGEEPKARAIARMIVQHRPLTTTVELAKIAAKAWPGHSKSHPATRTFQALRIAVNDELQMLRQALKVWSELLAPGGRLGIISFHSLEDRIVKQELKELAGDRYDADLKLITKSPVTAGSDEIVLNPRSRSAKLRVAVKIKT